MKDHSLQEDLKLVRKFLGLSQEEMGQAIGVSRISINRYENGLSNMDARAVESFYSFCFRNHNRLGGFNHTKCCLLEDDSQGRTILYHGAKGTIDSAIDISHSQPPTDFGKGFCLGQSYLQAATWVAEYPSSSVYFIRSFMNGSLAVLFDNKNVINSFLSTEGMLNIVKDKIKPSQSGNERYSPECMRWIGYIYRYWAMAMDISSKDVFRMAKAPRMASLYPLYHTADPMKAVSMIMDVSNQEERTDFLTFCRQSKK